ncbi:MAG: cytidylate kinase [Chloroflexi bacterium ADurb.Bin325]|nr:MAG: cytidylate kinase [Chloroflexi bacterium ADurb.Bin325]
MAVITLSRELGSEGDAIADALCQQLGYRRIDKEMLSEIAARAGVDVEAVLAMERSFARRARLVSTEMTSLYRKSPTAFDKRLELDDKTYADIVRKTLEEYAAEGNVVIVGRGGQIVLSNRPGTLHVHLFASVETRIQRLVARYGISEGEARRRIADADEEKRQAIRHMYNNVEWKNLRHYHLAINTAVIPPATAIQMIVTAAEAVDRG